MGIQDNLTCILRKLNVGQEVTELHVEQQTFKIEKEVQQDCILSPCLTYMQSTLCEKLGWMSYKLKSRLLGEIIKPSQIWK